MDDHTYEVSSSQEEIFSNGWTQCYTDATPHWLDGMNMDMNKIPENLLENDIDMLQPNDIIYDVTQVDVSGCQPLLDLLKEEVAETPPPFEMERPSASYVPSSLPASENWPGEHGFTISLDKATKGQWTYSLDLNKLFVVKDAACAINFSTTHAMPKDTFIRAMVLYSSPESVSEVVKRCRNHSEEEREKSILEAEHLIRCDSKTSWYDTDAVTNHHMVLIPFDNPPVGQDFSTYIFKFTCLGSCPVPGPDRRPLMIVFSLISGNQVVGRGKLNVKICACPKRDKGTEEDKFSQQGSKKRMKSKKKRTASELESLPGPSVMPLSKKKKAATPNSEGYYQLKVKDLKCLNFLEQMKKYYEIVNTVKSLSPEAREVLEQYTKRKGYSVDDLEILKA